MVEEMHLTRKVFILILFISKDNTGSTNTAEGISFLNNTCTYRSASIVRTAAKYLGGC
ncbi:hypothetical protein D3C73_1143160 [compost metagenome]